MFPAVNEREITGTNSVTNTKHIWFVNTDISVIVGKLLPPHRVVAYCNITASPAMSGSSVRTLNCTSGADCFCEPQLNIF